MRIAQFSPEVCEQLIIHGKLPLQRAIGHPPAAAQQSDHLIEHRIELHHGSNPEPFVPDGPARSERAPLGVARGAGRTGEHGGRNGQADRARAFSPACR